MQEQAAPEPVRLHGPRNASTRIDRFEELNPMVMAALRSFCRRIQAPHLLDETLLPTQQEGDASIYAAVRDRPWPPWGLGARHLTAVCQVQAIADESFAISPIYVTDDDATNVGLLAAVYKEVLEGLAVSPNAEVNYLVAEGSQLADHVLTSTGFRRYDDVFLTEEARYYTYRVNAQELLKQLGLTDLETPNLLAGEMPVETLERHALFHSTVLLGSRAEWFGAGRVAELIRLVRGGHAGKPGGVPSGTARWAWPVYEGDPDRDFRFFVSLENFLVDGRPKLLEFVLANEQAFQRSTIVPPHADEPVVDDRARRSQTLDNLAEWQQVFDEKIREVIAPVLTRLNHQGFPLGRIEMQATASGDGDYFRLHRDGDNASTREISFVYFFFNEPRHFSGGELRIFDNERTREGELAPTDLSQTLSPRQDLIVFFPSRNEHEILPVRVPTQAFAESRFTINGWIHRATDA
jgi:hypothetical protein